MTGVGIQVALDTPLPLPNPATLPVPLSSIPVASSVATSQRAFSSRRQALWLIRFEQATMRRVPPPQVN